MTLAHPELSAGQIQLLQALSQKVTSIPRSSMKSSNPISEDGLPSSEAENAVPSVPDTLHTESGSDSSSTTSPILPYQESSAVSSLDVALGTLTLSEPTADRMFRALGTIFEASQLHDPRIAVNVPPGEDAWAVLQRADSYENSGYMDIPSLVVVKDVMDQMLLYQSQFLLPALRLIADKSREGFAPYPDLS